MLNGLVTLDACGVCGGSNSTCVDCVGVPNGDLVLDECGNSPFGELLSYQWMIAVVYV